MDKHFFFLHKRITYTDNGTGNVILLIHGYLESKSIWDDFARELAENYRVITIDLPGHGNSELVSETQSMELMAEVARDLLVNLGIRRALVCGHSLGGYIALAFAALYPGMLNGYCLFHSHPFADTPEALEKREREIRLIEAGKKDLMYPENVKRMYAEKNLEKFQSELERSKEIAAHIPGEGIIAVLRGMMARPSRLDVIEKGDVPCLWILGTMDNYVDYNKMKIGVKLPPGSFAEVLENSGHLGFIEEKEKALSLLRTFADSVFK